MGVTIKPGYSIKNLIAIPLLSFPGGIAAYFLTVQIIFLLKDPNYYNVSDAEIGLISNNVIFYSLIFQMVVVIVVGTFFDLFGRRLTLTVTMLMEALVIFLLPYMAPNVFPGVYILRIIFAMVSMGPVCSPLINDYVSKGTRGRATALLTLGYIAGEFFNNVVLLNLIKKMSVGF
jgi:MFS family permease